MQRRGTALVGVGDRKGLNATEISILGRREKRRTPEWGTELSYPTPSRLGEKEPLESTSVCVQYPTKNRYFYPF